MDCKLSRASLIELQLIPPKLLDSSSLCPCCDRPVIEHRDEIGLGRIPFTRKNVFPRLKRTLRKNVLVSMMVGALVVFVVVVLGTLINLILTMREKNKQEISNYIQQYQKKSSDILSNPYRSVSIINGSEEYFSIITIPNDDLNNESLGLLLSVVISFCLVFSMGLISLVLWYFCLPKSNFVEHTREENNIKQGIPVAVKVYRSVPTQFSC